MGAADFVELAKEPNASDAFAIAHRHAQYEHGHGGYTGTLAEKGSFTIVSSTTRSLLAAQSFADTALGYDGEENGSEIAKAAAVANDKWGPAAAVPVCIGALDRDISFTVQLRADPSRAPWRRYLEELLRAEKLLHDGDIVTSLRVEDLDVRTRIEMGRTEGKAVIRYFYTNARTPQGGSISKGNAQSWISGFTSMAEWRKHAKETAKVHGGSYSCYGITRRFDDEPLDCVEAIVTKRTVKLDVKAIRPETGNLKTDAWLFFGMASY